MLRAFSSSRALAPGPRVMGEFATIVLGLGLISLGAALLAHVITGVQLPPGITEIAITVLAIAGRALLAQTKRHAGREDKPPQIDTEPTHARSHVSTWRRYHCILSTSATDQPPPRSRLQTVSKRKSAGPKTGSTSSNAWI